MPRTDTAAREIAAEPARVYAAFVDADALVAWLPPAGATGRFEHFDARPGGSYRLILSFGSASPEGGASGREDSQGGAGKAGDGTDVVDAVFTELVPGERVVQAIEFPSEDPSFGGTMTMSWIVEPSATGSRVTIRAEHVPPGISAAEHAVGLASSLQNLARYLER